jgi:PadR family transcriptional regulator PadR
VGRQIDLLQGTLDMLILKAVSLGPLHGYGVLLRHAADLRRTTRNPARIVIPSTVPTGAPGLDRQRVGESDNKRKAKFYSLSAAGRRQLRPETEKGKRMASLIASILRTTPEEI